MKYYDRSIVRKMAQFMLSKGRVSFPHKLLREKLEQICFAIPNKKTSLDRIRRNYHNYISGVRKLLIKEHKRVLISVWSIGYKLADDDEKNIEGFKKTEKAFQFSNLSNQILDTVDLDNLDKDGKELYHQLKVTNSLRGKLHSDLLENLKSRKLLPELENKDKK